MTITAGLVLFMVIWFLTLFVALPIRIKTQYEDGRIVPGTPASAPAEAMLRRKILWVTIITLALWIALCAVILFSGLTVRDFDFWGRM